MNINEAIDYICDEINLRDRTKNGVNIHLPLMETCPFVYELINMFSVNDEIITLAIDFDDVLILRWAETRKKHELWRHECLFSKKV